MTESGRDPPRAGPVVATDRGALLGIRDFVACVEALLLDVELELEAAAAAQPAHDPTACDPPAAARRDARAGPRRADARRVVRRRRGL